MGKIFQLQRGRELFLPSWSLPERQAMVLASGLQRLLETLVCKHLQPLSVKNPPQRLSSILSPVVETDWVTKSDMHSLRLNGWTVAVCLFMHFLKISK